jgi:hypothetical protein
VWDEAKRNKYVLKYAYITVVVRDCITTNWKAFNTYPVHSRTYSEIAIGRH